MSKASRGAYVPGAQGYSLAEAIDGITPTGVSGDDSRDRKRIKCRWKGCPTILSTVNLPGQKSARKQTELEESETEQEPEPVLEQSGIRESAPPGDLPPEESPPEETKKKGKQTKKGHVPSRKISREGLCFPHQQAVNFYEMGLETVEPEFEDDP